MKLKALLLIGLLALALAGCQALEIGVNTGRGGASIDITVMEDELNALLADATVPDGSGVTFTPTITFDNGQIVLNAGITDETGASATGSITFIITEEDNQLRLYAASVALTGADSNGERVLDLSVSLNSSVVANTAGQTGAVFEGDEGSLFVQSIQITPGELNVRIQLP